ncbi:MAG: 30S ribosomal protein S6, partial [Deltaproteobacteria bacterium]|nr:30S ribosomal protein S6 [Deltaproteobacteria bacterium]
RAREYESIFILNPDSQADVIDNIAGRCQDIISRLEGKLLRAENWGRRRLAYPVKKHQKGIYIYLRYLGYQDLVHELERNFRAIDAIIKFLSVKVDEDVNPDARPINESDISFVSTFIESEEAVEEAAPAADDAAPEAVKDSDGDADAEDVNDDAAAENATDDNADDDSSEEDED